MWCSSEGDMYYWLNHQEKLRFQQRLQEQHGDSKLIILHEYNPDVNSVRIRFEIISKHVNAQNESTSLVPSHTIKESNYEVIEAPCIKIVEDLEVVETPCVEVVKNLEDVMETC